ncbi:MAG: hypothetical protein ACI8XB_002138 [Patiriisocius sp.]|jgi:hypothetical protein
MKENLFLLRILLIITVLSNYSCENKTDQVANIELVEDEKNISHWPNDQRMVINITVDLSSEDSDLKSEFKNNKDKEALHLLSCQKELSNLMELLKEHSIRVTTILKPDKYCTNSFISDELEKNRHEIAGFYTDEDGEVESFLSQYTCDSTKKDQVVHGLFGKSISEVVEHNLNAKENNLKYWSGFLNNDFPQRLGDSTDHIIMIPSQRLDFNASNERSQLRKKFVNTSHLISVFDNLYAEAENTRIMMGVVFSNDKASIKAQMETLEDFIVHAKKHEGVVFMKNIDIARLVEFDPDTPELIPISLDKPL